MVSVSNSVAREAQIDTVFIIVAGCWFKVLNLLLCFPPLQEQLLWCVLWSSSVTREAHICHGGLVCLVAALHEVSH